MTESKKAPESMEDKAVLKYAVLMQRIAEKVARANIPGKPNIEQGAALVSRAVTDLSEAFIKKFSGTLGLADLMAILGTIAAQNVVMNAKHGAAITYEMIPEAADIFYGAILYSLRANKVVLTEKKIVRA